jgi:hypothetical protein
MSASSPPLNIATLRLSGRDEALADLVDKLKLEVAARHKAGESGRRGSVYATSGLNAPVADGSSPSAMIAQVRAFLDACLAYGPTLFTDVDAEISLGVSVGDENQFMASVDISPTDVRAFAALGIALNVTAYPRSEAESEPEPESGHF